MMNEPQSPSQGQPDLVMGAPSVSDSGPAAGATFTLSVTVRNDGDGASPATTLRCYRSTSATITTSDTTVGTDAITGIVPSGSRSESVDLTAPSTPGTYYYGACVDAVMGESNTTNNCSTPVRVTVAADEPAQPSTIDARQFCGRTSAVRRAILAAVQGATATCIEADPNAVPPIDASYETNITESQLARISSLNLSEPSVEVLSSIREFKPGDFDGLTGLRVMNLSESLSSTAKNGLAQMGVPLSVLGRLEKLYVVNNDLIRFESSDFFRGLSNLRELDITINNLVYELPGNPNRPEGTCVGQIDPEVWKPLANLRKLKIGSNRILTLSQGFFSHLTKLEELDMYDMWYEYHPYGFGSQALPAGIFEGLTNLRKLDLGYNAIGATTVDDGLFDGLRSLEELDLRENPLLEVLPKSVLNLPSGVTILTDPGVEWPVQEENRKQTGLLVINGTARVGETLTASVSGVADELTGATFAYQWISNDGTADTEIDSATEAAYILVATDEGKTIKTQVTFTDDGGTGEMLTSAVTSVVDADIPQSSGLLRATIPGQPAFSVSDTRGEEAQGVTLAFTVSLSRAANAPVTVDYATVDGSATAGLDYTATSGTLTFAIGVTEQTVSVPLLDDAHDEGEETLILVLSNASGARIHDAEAEGIIESSDPLQRAWLARFGRTVATHVTDAVGERLRMPPTQGSHLTVGGYRLPVGQNGAEPEATPLAFLVTELAGMALGLGSQSGVGGPGPDPWADAQAEPDPRLGQSQTLRLPAFRVREVLLGSSFRLALGAADDARPGALRLTAWGRVASTRFNGQEDTLALDGDVLTGTLGVDGEWDRWLAGVAVSHTRGDGSFSMTRGTNQDNGELDNTLTSIHPYLRYAVNERLDVWGLLGYGWGQLNLEMDNGETLETDANLVMGAFGGRGILLAALESGGVELATRTDAMFTRTNSEAVAGLESAEADAHRVRLILEGSRGFTWVSGQVLTPSVELGLRHDWGDAETGFGLELGGRVRYADPAKGLTIEVAVRGLLAHQDSDYEEWGGWGTLRVDPGITGQGLALTLSPAWGPASSGVDGLWAQQDLAGLAQNNQRAQTGRLNAEVGYGFAAFDTGLLTPYAGTVLAGGEARTYRVGTRLQLNGRGVTGLGLSLEGMRQELERRQPPNQSLRLKVTWRF